MNKRLKTRGLEALRRSPVLQGRSDRLSACSLQPCMDACLANAAASDFVCRAVDEDGSVKDEVVDIHMSQLARA